MSLEDSVDTLPDIIKSLAQQLSSRDAQLKVERANYIEKLSVMREEYDGIRSERDHLADDLGKEKALYTKMAAAFDIEKADFLKRIEHLEQAANHQADALSQTRCELEQWKNRHVTMAEASHRQWGECSSHLSRMVNKLDELGGIIRRQSDSGSSPTVFSSMSSNKPSSTDNDPPGHTSNQNVLNPKTLDPASTPTRATSPTLRQARIIGANHATATSILSNEKSQPTPSRNRKTSKSGGPNPSYQVPRKQSFSGKVESSSVSTSQHSPKKPSHAALPPDRVIVTAHFELKEEESDGDDSTHLKSSSSKILHPRVEHDDDEGEIEGPSAKRRKMSTRKQVIDDDDEYNGTDADADEVYSQVEGRKLPRNCNGLEDHDFDDMAIGAEHNHKEIYGYRRVHVREVNAGPRTPPSQRTRNVTQSGGTSSDHRKASAISAAPHGRRSPAKNKR